MVAAEKKKSFDMVMLSSPLKSNIYSLDSSTLLNTSLMWSHIWVHSVHKSNIHSTLVLF